MSDFVLLTISTPLKRRLIFGRARAFTCTCSIYVSYMSIYSQVIRFHLIVTMWSFAFSISIIFFLILSSLDLILFGFIKILSKFFVFYSKFHVRKESVLKTQENLLDDMFVVVWCQWRHALHQSLQDLQHSNDGCNLTITGYFMSLNVRIFLEP